MVRVPPSDASSTAYRWASSGMIYWEEALGQIQDMLETLCLSFG